MSLNGKRQRDNPFNFMNSSSLCSWEYSNYLFVIQIKLFFLYQKIKLSFIQFSPPAQTNRSTSSIRNPFSVLSLIFSVTKHKAEASHINVFQKKKKNYFLSFSVSVEFCISVITTSYRFFLKSQARINHNLSLSNFFLSRREAEDREVNPTTIPKPLPLFFIFGSALESNG